MQRMMWVLATAATLCLVACDGEGPDPMDAGDGVDAGGGTDAGMSDTCVGEADGAACGTGLICLSEACESSECGDGYLDTAASEECDDGNDVAFDGCEPSTCTFTCSDDAACDDRVACNGAETCSDHVCALGTPPTDGTTCDLDGGAGVCRAGACVDPGCGNGVVDGDEECDDSNDVDDDGCDIDCTFSCSEDLDCADGSVCTGDETCDLGTHACIAGTPLDCADGDDCTSDECHGVDGCQNPLIDGDMDGHASDTLGACGDDCDDARPDIYTGAEELCDGVDNNCNTDIDEIAPTWYIDCDRDGFAASTDGSRTGCTEPASSATGCSGRWTATRPVDATNTDCGDGNADVHPGQTAYFTTAIPGEPGNFDYDCNGTETRQFGCTGTDGTCGSRCSGGFLPSSSSNPNGCTFICVIGGSCFARTSPECGQSADYRSCGSSSLGCLSTFPSRRTRGCH